MKSKISFQERAKLAMEKLSKQRPITIEIAREQVIRLRIAGSSHLSRVEKENKVWVMLAGQHPDWTKEQIETELKRLFDKYEKI